MGVIYKDYFGYEVSEPWFVVLSAADAHGVNFRVNSGHRSLAKQQYLWDGWQRRAPGFNRAAYPSNDAPHIRTGRIDHAVDVENTDGGAQRLANWLRANGVSASFPVPGESWHIEVPADQLERLAARFRDKYPGASPAEHRHLLRIDYLKQHPEQSAALKVHQRWAWDRRKALWGSAKAAGRTSKAGRALMKRWYYLRSHSPLRRP